MSSSDGASKAVLEGRVVTYCLFRPRDRSQHFTALNITNRPKPALNELPDASSSTFSINSRHERHLKPIRANPRYRTPADAPNIKPH